MSDWIKWDDQQPGEDAVILVYDEWFDEVLVAHFAGYMDDDCEMPLLLAGSYQCDHVTHWKPVPDRPEEFR